MGWILLLLLIFFIFLNKKWYYNRDYVYIILTILYQNYIDQLYIVREPTYCVKKHIKYKIRNFLLQYVIFSQI